VLAGAVGAAIGLVVHATRAGVIAGPITFAAIVGGGAVLGGLFGRVSRRLFGLALRIVWAVAMGASLWLLLYAFVLSRFFPVLARSTPFLSTLPYIVIFGLCVGAMPPVGTQQERGRSL
jgi:hypothetical protein